MNNVRLSLYIDGDLTDAECDEMLTLMMLKLPEHIVRRIYDSTYLREENTVSH